MADTKGYTFTGRTGPEEAKPKDVDLSHDSPHHTLGEGPLQAAKGNHTHPVSTAGVPSHTHIEADLPAGIATDGEVATAVGNHAALAGHELMANSNPADLGAASPGTATTVSRADHVHRMPTPATLGAADAAHTHLIADLPSTLATDTEVATAVSDHAALSDPHPNYLKPAEVLAGTNITVDLVTTPGSAIINASGGGGGLSQAQTLALGLGA